MIEILKFLISPTTYLVVLKSRRFDSFKKSRGIKICYIWVALGWHSRDNKILQILR